MANLDAEIAAIQAAADKIGAAALAEKAGVPYTTVVDWRKAGFQPKWTKTFSKLAAAARSIEDEGRAA